MKYSSSLVRYFQSSPTSVYFYLTYTVEQTISVTAFFEVELIVKMSGTNVVENVSLLHGVAR